MALAQTRTKKLVPKDPAYRDQLITEYLPYVKRIVQRLAVHLPSTVDIDDLMNVGVIGLIQAVDRYDPRRDNKFMTYAIFRIKGAVLSELRARDFLSRSNRRKIRELESAYLRLEQRELDHLPGIRSRLSMGRRALIYTTFNLLFVIALSIGNLVSPLLSLPYAAQWMETIWGTINPAIGARPTAIGIRQLIVSILFTILFILTW